ncbi:MAG: TatD family hydrolase [Methanobacteriaceae archaeon]|nr:TatD family hydrolase [Methanobacteriaceae archaeon]
MIDSHIHADTRPIEDFEKMAIAGVESVITCAHDPLRMSSSDVVLDHFHRLLTNDRERALKNGLNLYTAIGIHPRSISKDYEVVISKIPSLIEDKNVVAIGEIGLETASELEKEVFKKQLTMADELKMKVIVHTPRSNKKSITKITCSLIEESIEKSLVVIDHVDNTIIDYLIDFGTMLGITVQPLKMNPDEAVDLLNEYGVNRFLLNSDMSSSPSDPLSVPKTVHKMKLDKFRDSEIAKVSHDNASNFFNIE